MNGGARVKKYSLMKNSLVLTGFSVAMRVAGIAFSMYVSAAIGAEGMGLYQLTYSAFALGVTMATAGISVAVTRVLTEEQGMNRRGSEAHIMRCAFAYAGLVSAAVAAAVFMLSAPIGNNILADSRAVLSLKVLSPAIPMMALSACFKGHLLAVRRPIQIAISDVIEQSVEVGVFVILIHFMPGASIETACAVIAGGVTLSEIVSAAYLYAKYRKFRERTTKKSVGGFLRRLLAVALPVAGSSCLASLLRTVENVMVPAGLRKSGLSEAAALSDYGMVRGMALPVMFLPFAFLSAFTSLVMPEVSEAQAAGRHGYIHTLVARVVKWCLLMSIPAAAVFMIFSEPISVLVYKNSAVGAIILTLAPLVPLMYFDAVADGILKGLGQQNFVLYCNIVDSMIRVGMVLWLIPALGFRGFMIVMYVSNILNPVLSIWRMTKLSNVKIRWGEWIIKPALAAAVAALTVRILCIAHPAAQASVSVIIAEILLLGTIFASVYYIMRDRSEVRKNIINQTN
jgi:stage V sporulation protein B